MRPDFAAIRAGQRTYAEALGDLDRAGLLALTNDYYDEIEALIGGVTDEGAVAVPHDPALDDQQAGEGAWTLGHVLVHLTASCDETGALASALARGVELPPGLRLRAETPWETITTAGQLSARLTESRRICLAFLDTWPDAPHLDLTVTMNPRLGALDAIRLCGMGFSHADSHLEQLREIMRQLRERGMAGG